MIAALADNVAGLAIAAALVVYLVIVLVVPEKF